MGREIQKRKNRSSRPKIRQRRESKAALRNPRGNAIIAANWDNNATLSQNYERLGLVSKLNSRTGGTEKKAGDRSKPAESLLLNSRKAAYGVAGEVQVEKDPVTGRILRVLPEASHKANPLGDLLLDLDSDSEDGVDSTVQAHQRNTGVIRQLEEEAAMEAPKRVRQQSQREQDWIERLVERHGQDYARMARDRKLNPMQQTEADIRRRIEAWTQRQGR